MNPYLLACAVHEIGHGLAWSLGGMYVRNCAVWPTQRGGARGMTYYDLGEIDGHAAAFLVGMYAGGAAEALAWKRLTDVSSSEGRRALADSVRGDMQDLELQRVLRMGVMPESTARSRATSLVKSNWGRIEHLGRKLAKDRSLPGRKLR